MSTQSRVKGCLRLDAVACAIIVFGGELHFMLAKLRKKVKSLEVEELSGGLHKGLATRAADRGYANLVSRGCLSPVD